MNSVSLSRKAYKRMGARKGSERVKYRRENAINVRKRQLTYRKTSE